MQVIPQECVLFMQTSLDTLVSLCRFQLGRIGFPSLVLGICAFACLTQQAAPGQAQLGAAESCLDGGPDKLPERSVASIPSLPAPLPLHLAHVGDLAGIRPVKGSSETLVRAHHERSHNKDRRAQSRETPDEMLAAAR
jgi:hypothetical protein